MTDAERQRKRRGNRAKGMCVTCCVQPARPGRAKCAACAEIALDAAYASKGLVRPKKPKAKAPKKASLAKPATKGSGTQKAPKKKR